MLSRFSRVRLCATLWIAAHQAPPSTGFSSHEYWSGLPFPSPSFSLWDKTKQTVHRISNLHSSKHQSHRRQEKSEKPPQTRGCWGDVKTKCNSASWGDPETEEGVREQQVKSEDRVGEGEVTETDWHCPRVVTNTSITQDAHREGGDWGVPRELYCLCSFVVNLQLFHNKKFI